MTPLCFADKAMKTHWPSFVRQRDTSPALTGSNTIEGVSHKRDEQDRAAHLACAIDRAGNVTYYADQSNLVLHGLPLSHNSTEH